MGKPKSVDGAIRMLEKLSGKTHNVTSGVTVIDSKSERRSIMGLLKNPSKSS